MDQNDYTTTMLRGNSSCLLPKNKFSKISEPAIRLWKIWCNTRSDFVAKAVVWLYLFSAFVEALHTMDFSVLIGTTCKRIAEISQEKHQLLTRKVVTKV